MKRDRAYYVYILTNRSGTLYTGVTSDLERRVWEHRQCLIPSFTSRYKINRLVYYEETNDVHVALNREKQVKAWTRAKRIALINGMNPRWLDLAADWYDEEPSGEIR